MRTMSLLPSNSVSMSFITLPSPSGDRAARPRRRGSRGPRPDPHLERMLLHVDPLDPERRCMDKQAEKLADQLRSALEWVEQQRPDQGHHAGRPYLQRSHTQQPGQPSGVGLCAESRNGSAHEPKVYGQVGEL